MRCLLDAPAAATRAALALALALAALTSPGCKRSADPAPTPADPAPTPAAPAPTPAAPAPTPAAPLAEGWTRLDLATLDDALSGSVDLPPGIEATVRVENPHDSDGLQLNSPRVTIGHRECGVSLAVPPARHARLASADAMARFHGNFEVEATRTFAADHWAVTQRWRPGECMVHGWSGAAGLTCDVFKCPCDDIQRWVDVCASVRPGPAPNAIAATPASAFPDLPPAAAEVAITVARAIARDDKAMLRGALGPAGLEIGGEAHDAAALDARLKGKSVIQAVAADYAALAGDPPGLDFNGRLDNEGRAWIFLSNGYGEQPFFSIEQAGDRWHLTGFGVFDHGEP